MALSGDVLTATGAIVPEPVTARRDGTPLPTPSTMEIKNAIIESVSLSSSDRGFLDCWVHLNYGGSGQGFGGFVLYLPTSYSHHSMLSPAGHFIFRVMEVAGVTDWESLKGKTVRVKGNHSKVYALGHVINDDWFAPTEDFEAIKNPTPATEFEELLNAARIPEVGDLDPITAHDSKLYNQHPVYSMWRQEVCKEAP